MDEDIKIYMTAKERVESKKSKIYNKLNETSTVDELRKEFSRMMNCYDTAEDWEGVMMTQDARDKILIEKGWSEEYLFTPAKEN